LDGQPVYFLVKIRIEHVGHEQPVVVPYNRVISVQEPDDECADDQYIQRDKEYDPEVLLHCNDYLVLIRYFA
jgi:hypothetical protein